MTTLKEPALRYHRHSLRLPDYDYSEIGDYFITLVSRGREEIFGQVQGGAMSESAYGIIVREIWEELGERYPLIRPGAAVVMPNHFHGILSIVKQEDLGGTPSVGASLVGASLVGAIHELPQRPQREIELPQRLQREIETPPCEPSAGEVECQRKETRLKRRRMLLPLAVGYLKMNSAKRINLLRGTPGQTVWQRNYYEHIIRSEQDYQQIEYYIETNPQSWQEDLENKSREL